MAFASSLSPDCKCCTKSPGPKTLLIRFQGPCPNGHVGDDFAGVAFQASVNGGMPVGYTADSGGQYRLAGLYPGDRVSVTLSRPPRYADYSGSSTLSGSTATTESASFTPSPGSAYTCTYECIRPLSRTLKLVDFYATTTLAYDATRSAQAGMVIWGTSTDMNRYVSNQNQGSGSIWVIHHGTNLINQNHDSGSFPPTCPPSGCPTAPLLKASTGPANVQYTVCEVVSGCADTCGTQGTQPTGGGTTMQATAPGRDEMMVSFMAENCEHASGSCGRPGFPPRDCSRPDRPDKVMLDYCRLCQSGEIG